MSGEPNLKQKRLYTVKTKTYHLVYMDLYKTVPVLPWGQEFNKLEYTS